MFRRSVVTAIVAVGFGWGGLTAAKAKPVAANGAQRGGSADDATDPYGEANAHREDGTGDAGVVSGMVTDDPFDGKSRDAPDDGVPQDAKWAGDAAAETQDLTTQIEQVSLAPPATAKPLKRANAKALAQLPPTTAKRALRGHGAAGRNVAPVQPTGPAEAAALTQLTSEAAASVPPTGGANEGAWQGTNSSPGEQAGLARVGREAFLGSEARGGDGAAAAAQPSASGGDAGAFLASAPAADSSASSAATSGGLAGAAPASERGSGMAEPGRADPERAPGTFQAASAGLSPAGDAEAAPGDMRTSPREADVGVGPTGEQAASAAVRGEVRPLRLGGAAMRLAAAEGRPAAATIRSGQAGPTPGTGRDLQPFAVVAALLMLVGGGFATFRRLGRLPSRRG